MGRGSYTINKNPPREDSLCRSFTCALLVISAICLIILLATFNWISHKNQPKGYHQEQHTHDALNREREEPKKKFEEVFLEKIRESVIAAEKISSTTEADLVIYTYSTIEELLTTETSSTTNMKFITKTKKNKSVNKVTSTSAEDPLKDTTTYSNVHSSAYDDNVRSIETTKNAIYVTTSSVNSSVDSGIFSGITETKITTEKNTLQSTTKMQENHDQTASDLEKDLTTTASITSSSNNNETTTSETSANTTLEELTSTTLDLSSIRTKVEEIIKDQNQLVSTTSTLDRDLTTIVLTTSSSTNNEFSQRLTKSDSERTTMQGVTTDDNDNKAPIFSVNNNSDTTTKTNVQFLAKYIETTISETSDNTNVEDSNSTTVSMISNLNRDLATTVPTNNSSSNNGFSQGLTMLDHELTTIQEVTTKDTIEVPIFSSDNRLATTTKRNVKFLTKHMETTISETSATTLKESTFTTLDLSSMTTKIKEIITDQNQSLPIILNTVLSTTLPTTSSSSNSDFSQGLRKSDTELTTTEEVTSDSDKRNTVPIFSTDKLIDTTQRNGQSSAKYIESSTSETSFDTKLEGPTTISDFRMEFTTMESSDNTEFLRRSAEILSLSEEEITTVNSGSTADVTGSYSLPASTTTMEENTVNPVSTLQKNVDSTTIDVTAVSKISEYTETTITENLKERTSNKIVSSSSNNSFERSREIETQFFDTTTKVTVTNNETVTENSVVPVEPVEPTNSEELSSPFYEEIPNIFSK